MDEQLREAIELAKESVYHAQQVTKLNIETEFEKHFKKKEEPMAVPAKRLLRTNLSDSMIGGVCGGIADYFGVDSTIIRIGTVVVCLFTGVPLLAYLIAWAIVPSESYERFGF